MLILSFHEAKIVPNSRGAHAGRYRIYAGPSPSQRPGILPPGPPGPQIYLAEEPADDALPAHFHAVDQFQVVVKGSGAFGKHEVAPFAVHYADAYSPYGPIRAGAGGLDFFTVRTLPDTALFPMPQA